MTENVNQNNASVSQEEFSELVALGKSGDSGAIGRLLLKYRNYLLLIANQDLDVKLRAKIAASDIVQESMMLAQQNFRQFRGESEEEFLGWLKMILVNDIRNNRRQFATQKRNAGLELNMQEQSAVKDRLVDPLLTPSSDAMQRERAQVLAVALEQMRPDYRQVIQLRNFEQVDFSEVGKRMNRSADAARKLWARAIEELQANLSAVGPDLLSGIFKLEETDE